MTTFLWFPLRPYLAKRLREKAERWARVTNLFVRGKKVHKRRLI